MSELLQKALMNTTDQSSLIPEDLSPMIHGLLEEEFPLWTLLSRERAQGPVHEYRIRATLPQAWFQGELANSDFRSATYASREVRLKIVRSWGGVSSFMQKMSERFVNALQEAIQTAVLGLANTMEYSILYGTYAADSFQSNGITAQLLADATAKVEYASGGNIYHVDAALTLTHLDNILDRTAGYRGSSADRRIIIASREMISRISGLQTRVTRDIQTVTYEGGFTMTTYRGVPLLPSDLLVPAATTTSPTLSGVIAAGGSLPAAGYYYAISSVTLGGEQKPSAATSVVTSATTNNTANLTWTADTNAKLYYIWRGSTNVVADMTLLKVIPALTYDSDGNITGAVAATSDDGTYTLTASMKPLSTGEQLFVVNISANERGVKIMGAVSPLGDPMEDYFTFTPLATINASIRFMIEGFIGYKVPYPTLNAILRRAKLS